MDSVMVLGKPLLGSGSCIRSRAKHGRALRVAFLPSSVGFSLAGFANTRRARGILKVIAFEKVAVLAVNLRRVVSRNGVAAKNVYLHSDGLQVLGINALRRSAEMVNSEPFWDLPNEELIRPPMSTNEFSIWPGSNRKESIGRGARLNCSGPKPAATGRNFDEVKESLDSGKCFWHGASVHLPILYVHYEPDPHRRMAPSA